MDLTFEKAIEQLDLLSGKRAQAIVLCSDASDGPLAMLSGRLKRVPNADIPDEIMSLVDEPDVLYQLGEELENHLAFGRKRFLRAQRSDVTGELQVVQQNGVIRIWEAVPWG